MLLSSTAPKKPPLQLNSYLLGITLGNSSKIQKVRQKPHSDNEITNLAFTRQLLHHRASIVFFACYRRKFEDLVVSSYFRSPYGFTYGQSSLILHFWKLGTCGANPWTLKPRPTVLRRSPWMCYEHWLWFSMDAVYSFGMKNAVLLPWRNI